MRYVDERERPINVDATSLPGGTIAGDGTVDERERPIIRDSAAIIPICRRIARDVLLISVSVPRIVDGTGPNAKPVMEAEPAGSTWMPNSLFGSH